MSRKIATLGSPNGGAGSLLNHLEHKIHTDSPDYAVRMHRHHFLEISLFQSDDIEYLTQDGAIPVKPGDVFVVVPPCAHGLKCHGREYDEYLLNCTPAVQELFPDNLFLVKGFHELFSNERVHHCHLTPEEHQDAVYLMQLLEQDVREQDPERDNRIRIHFTLFATLLSRAFLRNGSDQYTSKNRIDRVVSYLQNHFMEELRIDDLAEWTNLSRSQFMRLFQQTMGKGAIRYQTELRIRNAMNLLSETELPIKEVTLRCGFKDSNHFSRNFHRIVGCSPREFRRNAATAKRADERFLQDSQKDRS